MAGSNTVKNFSWINSNCLASKVDRRLLRKGKLEIKLKYKVSQKVIN